MTTRESASDPLHIVIVQPTANSTTFGWEQGLESLGHRVTVLTRSGRLQFEGRPGADLHVIPDLSWTARAASRSRLFHRWVGEFPRLHDVREAMDELRPDLALIRAERARSMVIAADIARRGIPWLLWQEKLPPLVRRWTVLRRLGVRPTASFTVLDPRPGGVAASTIQAGLEYISYAVPEWPAPAEPRPATPSAAVRTLVVASFKNHEAKRQWLVLDAAAEAGLLDGRMRFMFIGYGGPQHEGHRRVLERIERHGIEHLVEVRGGEPFARMSTIYDEHDLVVLPSGREQFGMTVIEAMGRARPIIISDAVGAKGCVVDGVTGLIFPSGDVAALGAAMRRFVDEPGLAGAMGSAAQEFTARHLDQRRIAEAILRLAGLR
jgi:glycosyltransferase involved in cell wall biosynthesis